MDHLGTAAPFDFAQGQALGRPAERSEASSGSAPSPIPSGILKRFLTSVTLHGGALAERINSWLLPQSISPAIISSASSMN